MNDNARCKQRFQNFERAYLLLNDDIKASIASMSEREKAGVIQHFEILVELSWKLMKDYLEFQGVKKVESPRNVVRGAFQNELVDEPETWIKALEMRNDTSHAYEQKIMEVALSFIENKFYPLVKKFYFDMKKEL